MKHLSKFNKVDSLKGVTESMFMRAPSLQELKAKFPKELFEFDRKKAFSNLFFSLSLTTISLVGSILLYNLFDYAFSGEVLWTYLKWVFFAVSAVVTGTISIGLWVLAHEAGHNGFDKNKVINHSVGFFLHTLFLVPYFTWARTHAVHHQITGDVNRGESHVPPKEGQFLSNYYKILKKILPKSVLTTFMFINYFIFGWPVYILFGASGGPDRGLSTHVLPINDKMFPGLKLKFWCTVSTLACIIFGYFIYWLYSSGSVAGDKIIGFYIFPLLVANFWLVLYTYLQHSDVYMPWIEEKDFTFERGGFLTIDRPYPKIIDILHHHIGTSHVVHHLFSAMPNDNAVIATEIVKKEYPEIYLYDPTPVSKAMVRAITEANSVKKDENGFWYYE